MPETVTPSRAAFTCPMCGLSSNDAEVTVVTRYDPAPGIHADRMETTWKVIAQTLRSSVCEHQFDVGPDGPWEMTATLSADEPPAVRLTDRWAN